MQEEYDYTVKPAAELGQAKVLKECCYESFSDKLLKIITNTLNDSGVYEETTENFVYDAIGNPTTYRGKTATWEKDRRLVSYNGHSFMYDAQGRRLKHNDLTFTYDSDGRLLQRNNGLTFFYDHTGIVGFKYNNQYYAYRKDAQESSCAF